MNTRCAAAALVATACLAGTAAPAHAWDGRRQGVVAGIGFGPAFLRVDRVGERLSRVGFGATLHVGYAPSDQWAVMLGGCDAFGFAGDGVTFTINAGVLLRHYLEPTGPGLFFEIGLTTGVWVIGDADQGHGSIGVQPLGLVGYELGRHVSVELLAAGGPTLDDTASQTVLLTVAWMGY